MALNPLPYLLATPLLMCVSFLVLHEFYDSNFKLNARVGVKHITTMRDCSPLNFVSIIIMIQIISCQMKLIVWPTIGLFLSIIFNNNLNNWYTDILHPVASNYGTNIHVLKNVIDKTYRGRPVCINFSNSLKKGL